MHPNSRLSINIAKVKSEFKKLPPRIFDA